LDRRAISSASMAIERAPSSKSYSRQGMYSESTEFTSVAHILLKC